MSTIYISELLWSLGLLFEADLQILLYLCHVLQILLYLCHVSGVI